MPRPPSVDPELVRQVMQRDPRPTHAEAAEILSGMPSPEDAGRTIAEMLGKPVSAHLIAKIIQRRGKEWNLGPAPTGGTWPAMDYACERALGQVRQEHKQTYDWLLMTAYERHQRGLLAADRTSAINAVAYVAHRKTNGLVTDYHPSSGFSTRPALPWEAGHYLRQPVPDYPLLELATALADEPPGEHREYWVRWREFYKATDADSLTRRQS